jgi:hypothetical protein
MVTIILTDGFIPGRTIIFPPDTIKHTYFDSGYQSLPVIDHTHTYSDKLHGIRTCYKNNYQLVNTQSFFHGKLHGKQYHYSSAFNNPLITKQLFWFNLPIYLKKYDINGNLIEYIKYNLYSGNIKIHKKWHNKILVEHRVYSKFITLNLHEKQHNIFIDNVEYRLVPV